MALYRGYAPPNYTVLKLFNKGDRQVIFLIKINGAQSAFKEQRFEDIQVTTELCQKISSYWIRQESGIPKSSIIRGLKALRFHPYKVSVIQKLIHADSIASINIFHWLLLCVHDKTVNPATNIGFILVVL
jgi:hypothetical protein